MIEAYLGEIRMWAGIQIPQNWMVCNGQSLNLSQYQSLYALIGTTYGGDGQTNFNLPDLRGRVPIGQGQGAGLTKRTVGQNGGQVQVTLSKTEQLPAHTHPVKASTDNGSTKTPGSTVVLAGGGTATTLYVKYDASPGKATTFSFNNQAVSACGGVGEHPNVMSTLGINFIICVVGLFPSQP